MATMRAYPLLGIADELLALWLKIASMEDLVNPKRFGVSLDTRCLGSLQSDCGDPLRRNLTRLSTLTRAR